MERAPPKSTHRFFVAILAIGTVLAIAGVTLVWWTGLRSPNGPVPCAGTTTYAGIVTDTDKRGLGGVIVSLSPSLAPHGTDTTVLTNDSGSWSASVSGGCEYSARAYWRSTSGPLLANVSGISRDSTFPVNVTERIISFVLFAEFAYSANVTIDMNVAAGVTFSVDAKAHGNISLGFLAPDGAGQPGSEFQLLSRLNRSATGSYALVYVGATAYRIGDVSGNSVVYVTPSSNGHFALSNVTDSLNRTDAINLDHAKNASPYVEIAGHGTDTSTVNVTTGSRIPFPDNATAFGETLTSTFRIGSGSYAAFALQITNTGASNECFVIYQKSFDFHMWYYAPTPTTCPT